MLDRAICIRNQNVSADVLQNTVYKGMYQAQLKIGDFNHPSVNWISFYLASN